MIPNKRSLKSDIHMWLCSIILLTIIGLLFIYSASSIFALDRFGSAHYFVKKQIIGLVLGLIAMVVACLVPLNLVKKLSPFIFLGSLGLTMLTMLSFTGQTIHGSARWLSIAGFGFQPSELLKIGFILYVAFLLSKKEFHTGSFWHSYLPFLCVLGISSVVLLLQPDFGLTITLAATTFILLFIAQFKMKHLLISIGALLPVAGFLIFLKPYRLARILTFMNPWADPRGAGFQIIQSLIAIGSGNWLGVGIAHSKQKFFYLPMQHTDFIFSIIAEETGFVGTFFLITLYLIFCLSGLRVAGNMKDPFCAFTTLGFIIVMSLQALINLAVTTGLVPTKGIGLPFVSYGNTSLVCSLAMVGLIINMAYRGTHSSSAAIAWE